MTCRFMKQLIKLLWPKFYSYILYIIILILHLSIRPCVHESGRSREAVRPVLKNFPFSGSLGLDATTKSPLIQPAMALAPD